MEGIKRTFATCKKEKRAALITYVTAGYPTSEETVEIMLGMEAGGAGKRLFQLNTDSCSALRRSHRAWPSFYRSHCGRSNDTKGKYASIEKWHHSHFNPGNSTRSQEKGPSCACIIHGLL